MTRMMGVLLAMVLSGVVAGCGLPRDSGTTLRDVRGGVLRVGVTENPPWTEVPGDGPPAGAEAVLVQRLATRMGATVQWYPGSESELMAAVKDRVLDLVIGGLDAAAPWTDDAALTRPFVTMRTVVAAPAGVPVPDDLAGVTVAVEAGTAEVAAVAAEDATVVPVREVTGDEGMPVVVGEWRLAELNLIESGHELGSHDHVWALPPGENGWQAEVERFLLAQTHTGVEELLVAAERAS
ncbi:substrate-binding periplasmic protein [Actinoplanes sp. G11-F43]|uniref:substrate-binding periplasmic protein n=1 Tax=Actinoplanes sp. G11-F43 TaxID=3424130 RepID=UPI003D342985